MAKRLPPPLTVQRRFRKIQKQRLARLEKWIADTNHEGCAYPLNEETQTYFRERETKYCAEILAHAEPTWWQTRRTYTLDDDWRRTPCSSCGRPASFDPEPVTCTHGCTRKEG